jgi:hypothetical protein
MTTALRLGDGAGQDLSFWPVRPQTRVTASSAASTYEPEVERLRTQLLAAIRHLLKNPITLSDRDPTPIDSLSVETAFAFIRRLPADRAFPMIAPDGEGGIMMVWQNKGNEALVTIDRTTLFLVERPGEAASYHFAPLRFDGETILSIILEHLPRR